MLFKILFLEVQTNPLIAEATTDNLLISGNSIIRARCGQLYNR